MKMKSFKNLKLNKKQISILTNRNLKGGCDTDDIGPFETVSCQNELCPRRFTNELTGC